MAEDITVEFTPTPQDYVNTYRMLQFRSTFSRITYGLLVLFGLCLFGTLLLPGSSNARMWPIVIGIIIFVGLAVWLPAYNIGRRAKGNEHLLAPTTWQFNDEQLSVHNQFTDARYDWAFFQGLVENKEYFFLRHSSNKRLYNFIPKRAFTSPEQMAAVRELFSRHTGAKKGPAVPSAANG